jgi:hypothetical protein
MNNQPNVKYADGGQRFYHLHEFDMVAPAIIIQPNQIKIC